MYNSKRATLLILFLVFTVSWLFPDGDSQINDSNVNLRDFPSLKDSKIIMTLAKSQKVTVTARTIEKDKIGMAEDNWYYVGVYGTQENGWVFGQFLSSPGDVKYEEISRMRLWRNIYADGLFKSLLGGDIYGTYGAVKLSKYKLTASRDTSFWQMKESGFTKLQTYATSFGEISVFFNPSNNTWRFRQIVISKANISDKFRIGVTVNQTKNIIGSDFDLKDKKLTYAEDSYWDKYVYEATVQADVIVDFSLARYFD